MSDERYRGLDVGDDEYVIYDSENPDAWIQSDSYTKHHDFKEMH